MIIDHHNHVWVGEATGEGFLENAMTAEAILEAMDQAGIERAGICTIAQDIQNDYILDVQKKHGDRLFGYCMINPRDRNAVQTLERYLDQGLQGLKLHPRLHGFPLSSPGLVHPLLEKCREYRVPVFSHGNGNEEFNTAFHFEAIARAFPDVPIIYGHMGAYNEVDNAIAVALRHDNIYLDTSLCSVDNLRTALNALDPERIMMSTDWPGSDFRVERLKVQVVTEKNDDARRLIEGESYRRLVESF